MMKKNTILITGASGMIGQQLITEFIQKGYQINTLSRKPIKRVGVKSYIWNVERNEIDEEAILTANIIIHIAGESVAAKRWTAKRKTAILNSRVNSTKLIVSILRKYNHQLHAYIGASAIGYYGSRGDEVLTEKSLPQKGFLSDVCVNWEEAHRMANDFAQRVVIYRIGVVLDKNEGALQEMTKTLPLSLNYLGNGKQYMSFIYIKDVIRLFSWAAENELVNGTFNAVSPFPVTNKAFIQSLSSHRNAILPITPVPGFVLRLIMGEAACIALDSQNCTAEKLVSTGFHFLYSDLNDVFRDIFLNQ
jgi:uncharacterized protein